jgi:hypothetical protein
MPAIESNCPRGVLFNILANDRVMAGQNEDCQIRASDFFVRGHRLHSMRLQNTIGPNGRHSGSRHASMPPASLTWKRRMCCTPITVRLHVQHLEQVAADLKVGLVFSNPGVPRGRGRIEHLFSTISSMLLCDFPGFKGSRYKADPKQLLKFVAVRFARMIKYWSVGFACPTRQAHGKQRPQIEGHRTAGAVKANMGWLKSLRCRLLVPFLVEAASRSCRYHGQPQGERLLQRRGR